MSELAAKLDIKSPEDWYNISLKKFHQVGGGGLCAMYHSMPKLLTTVYPEYLTLHARLTGLIQMGARQVSAAHRTRSSRILEQHAKSASQNERIRRHVK